ncbi:MAG: 4Fe-4S dicluster domain-containing protein [Acidobacteria bacterium]|nr:4Fe-4S dicluster domain-containing protein [Acidobacteriota bacterium]
MAHPSPLEILIFLALVATSAALFWRRFGRVLAIIRGSKPNADFTLRPLGPRLRKFFWEVALQGLVIRQRPLPGIAHAFVFWGFCAFALVTVNHLAQGVGLGFLSMERGFGRGYLLTAAGFAVAVALSIAGLAARRFLVRPVWLGKLSVESGWIAFLILTLMITFLASLWIEEATPAGKANWWAHTLALLAFLPLIPHTKHLHLVLSPAAVFLERDGFSRIPPLSGDEDFGLETGRDVTRIDSLQAFSCVECGRCTQHCPAFNTGKVLNPKQIILGLRDYLSAHGPGSAEPLAGAHISEEAIFQCTTCGGCEFQCPVGIQHLPVIIGLRRGLVNTGKWENEYGSKLFLALEKNGNALGFSSAERQKFIETAGLPLYDGSQEYCLWLGCMGAYDPQGREIVTALAQVLRHLGVSFGVLRRERCTGDPARRLGNDYLFSQLAETNLEELRSVGVRKMLSICPHCVRTMGEDWREFGARPPIEHHSELLSRLEARLPAANGGPRVVFHDPCYLGRYRNLYDEPRGVIARSAEVVDPPRARERSFCCGAGGGMMFLGEEKGKRVNVERAQELAGAGAEMIGTACPFCQTMFRDALSGMGASPPRLRDIAQIAAASLDRPG